MVLKTVRIKWGRKLTRMMGWKEMIVRKRKFKWNKANVEVGG